ncbi:MAG: histidine kinase, partial [Pseudomonas capeferrum]
LELRELIAAVYHLGGGVYSREALVMNMAAQMARLTEHEGVEELAKSRTARLLKIGLPELSRLRKVENPEVKAQGEESPVNENGAGEGG